MAKVTGGIFLPMHEAAEASRARLTGTPRKAKDSSKRATWRGRFAKTGIAALAGLMLATVAVTGVAVASVEPSDSIANSVAPAVIGATPESAGQGAVAFVDGAPTQQQASSTALPSGITSADGSRAPIGACDGSCGPYMSPEAQAERAAISQNLLLNRWRDATASFQNKYDMWAIGDLMNAASRTMLQGNIMAVGNGFWTVSQWVADLAINFEPINMLGAQMDQIGATLGQSMLNPSSGVALIPLILIVVVGIWMFASWRKAGPGASAMLFRRIAGLVATMAVFVVMVVGAQNSTTTAGGQYKPGVGSPGWIVTIANDSLSTAASVPVGAVLATVQTQTSGQIDADRSRAPGTANNNLCAESVNLYDKRFRESASPTALATPRIALTQTMDSMWRTTGLPVWKSAQLGTSQYAEYSYCRLLDGWTQTPARNAADFTAASGIPASARDTGQLVWTASSAEQIQRAMVGWAGCEPSNRGAGTWQWRTGWDQLSGVAADECQKWWNKKPTDNEFEGGLSVGYTMSDIEKKTENISNASTQANIQDYLASLNGANAAGNMFPLLIYAVSAFIMMCIFFGMALAVVIAKLFVVLGTITILPIMILALFRANGLEQLGAAAKQFIGSMLFAALSLVLLSVVVLTTFILVQFGNGSFGAGTVMALGWAAAAPVLAVISLNMIFKKVLKMPSPMSMKGGIAYGLASGAAGGAVGGFIGGRMARSAIERSGRQAIQGAGSSALSKVSGGRFGTTMAERRASMGRGMLAPATGGKGAAGRGLGAAGAAAGGVGTAAAGAASAAGAGKGLGTAAAAAGGAAAGGFLGSARRDQRQQAHAAARQERMAARVYASQQKSEARVAGGLAAGGTANGPRNLRAAGADGMRNAWLSTKQNVAERRSELWNGVKATANTMAHPIQHIRGDDLRAQYTDENGTFDEVGFRIARQDRLKSDAKKVAVGAAVVGGGVMTAGSSWVIGATAVGATYATAKASGAAWGVTKRAASNVTGRDRMAAYRNYQAEQAVQAAEQQKANNQTRRDRRDGGGGSAPAPSSRPPKPRTPVTGAPVAGRPVPPLPAAPANSATPFAKVAPRQILFDPNTKLSGVGTPQTRRVIPGGNAGPATPTAGPTRRLILDGKAAAPSVAPQPGSSASTPPRFR
jgi:hypothetical protein